MNESVGHKPHEVNCKDLDTETHLGAKPTSQPKGADGRVLVSCSSVVDKKSLEWKGKHGFQRNTWTSIGFG